jgi:capsular polysaccharide biosynthesis protein
MIFNKREIRNASNVVFLLILIAFLVSLAVFLISYSFSAKYRSSAKVLIEQNFSEVGYQPDQDLFEDSNSLAGILAEKIESENFTEKIPLSSQSKIGVQKIKNLPIIELAVISASPQTANQIADQLINFIKRDNQLLSSFPGYFRGEVIEEPSAEKMFFIPTPLISSIAVFFLFLILAGPIVGVIYQS